MSNKRDLKKIINCISSDLFAECVASYLYGNATKENVDALLETIISVNSDYVRRISHPEPGISKKKYFKNLTNDFNKQVSEIIDQIWNLD